MKKKIFSIIILPSKGNKTLKNLYGISGVIDLDGLFDPVREAARLLNMDLEK